MASRSFWRQVMASAKRSRRRGLISWLQSGSPRVKVYAGVDQITGQKLWLRQTVAARETKAETAVEAERVLTRLLSRVDEYRSPRTEVTVSRLVDRWLEVIDVENTSTSATSTLLAGSARRTSPATRRRLNRISARGEKQGQPLIAARTR